MGKTEIIAYHGWGFDHTLWEDMQAKLPERIAWKNFERGYFGNSNQPEFDLDADFKIVVSHSYGLHLCSDVVMRQADALLVISGFLDFHPIDEPQRSQSKRILKKMIRRFENHPRKVLGDFYRRVFAPARVSGEIPDQLNRKLLLDDLQRLNRVKRSLKFLQKSTKVCILHGADDAIVPAKKGREIAGKLSDLSSFFELKNSGHALPVTDAGRCSKIIINWLDKKFK